jgi:hypothetical protein
MILLVVCSQICGQLGKIEVDTKITTPVVKPKHRGSLHISLPCKGASITTAPNKIDGGMT